MLKYHWELLKHGVTFFSLIYISAPELRKKYIWQFMNLMLGHNQQLDLSNLQILNLQPKNIFDNNSPFNTAAIW